MWVKAQDIGGLWFCPMPALAAAVQPLATDELDQARFSPDVATRKLLDSLRIASRSAGHQPVREAKRAPRHTAQSSFRRGLVPSQRSAHRLET